MSIKLAISGCGGRMGRSIASIALHDYHAVFSLVGAIEAAGHDAIGADLGTVIGHANPLGVKVSADAKTVITQADVLIEFTLPDSTVEHLTLCQQLRKPMVIGTTGLSDAQRAMLQEASRAIPLVFSPNMSLGVNVLFELAQVAAQRLGHGFDVDIIEAHHRHKQDAPSGTAKRLAEVVANARKQPIDAVPVHAIRAGDIVGDHTVVLAGPAERLELTHRAHSREVFARGALRAAQFVISQKPGLYDMSHVLQASERK